MRPSQIKTTAATALELLEQRGYGTPDSLLLAWVAWEGLKVRTLSVGLAKMGFQVQHVYDVMGDDRVHTLNDYQTLFRRVFGANPQNIRGVSQVWKQLEDFRNTRHKIVHGMGSATPEHLERGTRLLASMSLDPDWLAGLKVESGETRVTIGSPFASMRSRGHRPKHELQTLVKECRPRR